jgi:hypothetical protein
MNAAAVLPMALVMAAGPLKVLSQHPELGCPGFQQGFGRTTKAPRGADAASRSGGICSS